AYNVVATTVIAVTRGDINGDGSIDLLDVRLCLQIAQGVLTGTPAQRAAADVDRDGDVDETDAEILAEYVIGMRSALP
ncbi:MAG TPA: dockerin type I repeat-containing protein, partial [Candidatus Heimdallarchaeota archaeon]|nr:dockerin type I repeat-containing protein [Candidatus Heimdallarchaeota archaeon]